MASASGDTSRSAAAATDEAGTYVDGVPVGAGNRGGGFVGPRRQRASAIGTNAFEEASVTTGASSAAFGNAQSGVISISTRTGGDKFTGAVGYETDELVRRTASASASTGSRPALSGPIVSNLTFFIAATLEGAVERRAGHGGAEPRRTPRSSSTAGDRHHRGRPDRRRTTPTSDTTYVAVQNFAVYTGKCDETMSYAGINIKNSTNPDIAEQLRPGLPGHPAARHGPRRPTSSGKLNYTYGTGSRVFLSAGAARTRAATSPSSSDYDLYNPQQIFGPTRATTRSTP